MCDSCRLLAAALFAGLVTCRPVSLSACWRALCTGQVSVLSTVSSRTGSSRCGRHHTFCPCFLGRVPISEAVFSPKIETTNGDDAHCVITLSVLVFCLESGLHFWGLQIRISEYSLGQGCEDGLDTLGFVLEVWDIVFLIHLFYLCESAVGSVDSLERARESWIATGRVPSATLLTHQPC